MTDEKIMQRVSEGDLSKAAILFERYHKKIYLYLAKMSGDAHAAEDLTQIVFEKLIQYRKSFDVDQVFENWIFRIAKNAFVDHTNKRKKMALTILQEPKEVIEENDTERLEEQDRLLHKAMAALQADDREILVLTRFEKMKYQDVAKLLSTTESNIKVKVFRAMDKLRNEFFKLSPQQ